MNLSSLPKVELTDLQRANYAVALMALIAAARLPIQIALTMEQMEYGKSQQFAVAVPAGFETLFKEIVIDVRFSGESRHAHSRISWQYKHLFGSSGMGIGFVSFHEGTWMWSIDNDGPKGSV